MAAEVAAEPSFRPPIPDFVDYSMGSLMERCWAGEPANRPTMQYVCNVLDEVKDAAVVVALVVVAVVGVLWALCEARFATCRPFGF